VLRRRIAPELRDVLDAFHQVVEVLEPAKRALTRVLPTTRLPGTPLPVALSEFEEALERASAMMPAWRDPALEGAWLACGNALKVARERARHLREEAPDLGGFEGLVGAVEHLLDPLDAFRSAEEAFRDPRRGR
jgi:hypothetical protein